MVSFSQITIFRMTNPPSITVSFLLFFFFQPFFTIRATSYSPVDHFAISCGNSGNIQSLDQRNWTGDIGSRIFSPIEPHNGPHSVTANSSVNKTIPYSTARLSRSEFFYSFPVTDGQKIIRLYFYPSSYLDFLRSESLFSVKAGPNTLLKDFNASLAADHTVEETILKEYYVTIDPDQRLNVTFTPSVSHPNAYAFINGIEVVSMPTDLYHPNLDNLTGLNSVPRPSPSLPSMPLSKSSDNAKKTRVISIVVGAASGIVVLFLIVLLTFLRLAKAPVKEGNSWWGQKTVATSRKGKTQGTSLSSDLRRCFSIDEIRVATNNFDDIFIVGFGGFGNVYKGYIDDGRVPVAIKRLKQGSQQGLQEFQTEIEMLSQLRHHHLVSLIGYCNDGNEMILVYEFMAHGTLREHLYNSDQLSLSWNQRLEICLGAARGLHYLHTGTKHAIIHREIKTTNILIDDNWMAKISDFGLSKVGPSGILRSNINISTVVKGSIGYLDPEYYMCQRLTEKSDVYSFGVVLLEVLCGRPPILRAVERQQQNLVEWVGRCVKEGEIHLAVDPFVREGMRPECLKVYTEIALKCVASDGSERPSMGDVMLGLESVMEILKKAEETSLGGTQNED